MDDLRFGDLVVRASSESCAANTTLFINNGCNGTWQVLFPDRVRQLRKWLEAREAELVAQGFLKEEDHGL